MASLQKDLFIASRFQEFAGIRLKLKEKINNSSKLELNPIDLNDGRASHKPPLEECLSMVRRSDYMVLLLGDSYGSIAPDNDKSFTHLEYLEAIRSNSSTIVLVYCIGALYTDGYIKYSSDSNLALWQKEVESKHTIGFFNESSTDQEIVDKIFNDILIEMYYNNNTSVEKENNLSSDMSKVLDELSGRDYIELDEYSHKNELTNLNEINLVEEEEFEFDQIFILRHPNTIAALEHKIEAYNAIEISDYGAAIYHLKRALELKPIDYKSNYWLAKMYLLLKRKDFFNDIVSHIKRASNIALKQNKIEETLQAYLVIVQAAMMVKNFEEGEKYINEALKLQKNQIHLYYEYAIFLLSFDKKKEALKQIIEAFKVDPKILDLLRKNKIFNSLMPKIQKALHSVKLEKENIFAMQYFNMTFEDVKIKLRENIEKLDIGTDDKDKKFNQQVRSLTWTFFNQNHKDFERVIQHINIALGQLEEKKPVNQTKGLIAKTKKEKKYYEKDNNAVKPNSFFEKIFRGIFFPK